MHIAHCTVLRETKKEELKMKTKRIPNHFKVQSSKVILFEVKTFVEDSPNLQ